MLGFLNEGDIKEIIINIAVPLVLTGGGVLLGLIISRWVAYQERKSFQSGDLTQEILFTANFFDDGHKSGKTVMKPRITREYRPLQEVFINPELRRLVFEAIKQCDPDNCKQASVVLTDPIAQEAFRKRIVGICSAITGKGHSRRMVNRDATDGYEAYACPTVARDGSFLIVRVDMIDRDEFRKFLNPNYRQELDSLEEEGSHDDMMRVFADIAPEVFDRDDKSVRKSSDRAFRVSLQFEK